MSQALVLGGGGPLARAWEVGVLSGLADAGLDLVTTADTVIGTSAGAIVASCLLGGADLEQMYQDQLVGQTTSTGRMSPALAARLAWLMLRHRRDATGYRIAAAQFAAATPTKPVEQRRVEVARLITGDDWPRTPLVITAVDAATGELVALTRDSGIGLIDTVVASTAAPGINPLAKVGGRALIDGGIASVTNVGLAAGHDRVVVLAPFARGNGPIPGLNDEVAVLQSQTPGVEVTVIAPDRRARRAMGYNPMDASRATNVARAGRTQAESIFPGLAGTWNLP